MLRALMSMVVVPRAMRGGPVSMAKWMAGYTFVAALAMAVWTAAPFAIWSAWGATWLIAWLVPATLISLAVKEDSASGGG